MGRPAVDLGALLKTSRGSLKIFGTPPLTVPILYPNRRPKAQASHELRFQFVTHG